VCYYSRTPVMLCYVMFDSALLNYCNVVIVCCCGADS
jgi:hypothetical protein